jgi:heptosyltransferase-2
MGPPLTGSERVLVRLPSWLGDFVMAEPLVRALYGRLRRGALTLVARAAHLELLDGRFPGAGRIAADGDAAEAHRAWRGHDVALLCTGSYRSAWTAWRARIPRRIGFARDGRTLLLTDAVVPARERGATPLGLGLRGRGRRWLPRPLERSLAELAALLGVTVRDPRPRIEPSSDAMAAARERRAALGIAPGDPYVLANVGARAGSAKGYPVEGWAAVLCELARRGPPLVLVGGPGEEPAIEAVRARLEGARALVDPPARLPELAAHCAEAALVLTPDTGPRHLARAVGAATLVLCGPTDPRHTAGERPRERLVRVAVPCGPCHREVCPLAGAEHHRCWTAIEPARIVEAALAMLPASATMPA